MLERDKVAEPVSASYVEEALSRPYPADFQWFKVALDLGAYLHGGDAFMSGTVGEISVAGNPSECFVKVWYVDSH